MQDKTKSVDENPKQTEPQGDKQDQAAQEQVGGTSVGGSTVDGITKAREDYQAQPAERDAKIKALEGGIAEAAKTAKSAEKLRAKMDGLRPAATRSSWVSSCSLPARETSRPHARCWPTTATTSRS